MIMLNEGAYELAQRRLLDAMDAQADRQRLENESRLDSNDEAVAQVQPALNNIRAAFNLSEPAVAALLRCIASKVASSNWSHFEHAQELINALDEMSDYMGDKS